jgi:putative DNA primase/helicase
MSNIEVALRYAQAGMPVFPCGADKKPIIVKSWPAEASTDETKIRAWWAADPDAIVGLPVKPCDLLVFDADRHVEHEDGVAHFRAVCGELPEHPIVQTAGNGEHHIFRQLPSEKIGNRKIGNGLETRGYKLENDGGYIIAAGSRLPDGRAWRLGNGSPSVLGAYKAGTIPIVPPSLADLARERAREENQKATSSNSVSAGMREQAYAAKALDNLARDLAATVAGNRNNTLNIAALKLGGMVARDWIGRATVEGRLFDGCKANGLFEDDGGHAVNSTIKSGIEAGLKSPHDDLPDREPPRHQQQQRSKKEAPPDDIELVMLEASKVKMVPVRWLWNERIAVGKLSLLAGEPGLARVR